MACRAAFGRFALVAFVLLAFAAALTSAAPCIACGDCQGSDNCLKVCQRDPCPKLVDLNVCKTRGQEAGRRVAKGACDLTLTFCNGGQRTAALFARSQVSLEQCGNAAFGECQRIAKDRFQSPCGYAFNGVNQCSRDDFQNFYNGEVDERCNKEADAIQRSLSGR